MSYNLPRIKEVFSDPEIRRLAQNDEWDEIDIREGNPCLLDSNIHFNP